MTPHPAGVLICDSRTRRGDIRKAQIALREKFGKVQNLQTMLTNILWVINLERARALRAGSHNPFGTAGLESFHVQFCQSLKIIKVALPQLVMTAAAFISQHLRLDSQMVQDLHRSLRDFDSFRLEVFEDRIVIGHATDKIDRI